ncbi:hypothetical protein [Oharaeibacter diazotrophicus]|uniref:Avidin family protein n=1 Tax=Oharaeibacter diazotrophicus TaxID=1920512 RepID=A0A4R6RAR0_9HYPH|nr:hypothetical protein [Oharaeibacter diazotrophicus]TDP83193.1 hypothetical protein EDD54_3150 [Oharaeibacter diazotrophicus]BBE72022.1 hypothetical protein OHA_1_01609 [Pleomorphomonas sp. SM30]GLS78787.1 hypothetical protein GCM10007904_41240 [Oharaeibacter diazotrophicus]
MKTATMAAAMLAAVVTGAAAQDVGGSYSVYGTNFDGSHYKGTVTIKGTGGDTCRISWNTGGTSSGLCMRSGSILAASYTTDGGAKGLVVYKIKADGSLDGTWTVADTKGVGYEVLTPR